MEDTCKDAIGHLLNGKCRIRLMVLRFKSSCCYSTVICCLFTRSLSKTTTAGVMQPMLISTVSTQNLKAHSLPIA